MKDVIYLVVNANQVVRMTKTLIYGHRERK